MFHQLDTFYRLINSTGCYCCEVKVSSVFLCVKKSHTFGVCEVFLTVCICRGVLGTNVRLHVLRFEN